MAAVRAPRSSTASVLLTPFFLISRRSFSILKPPPVLPPNMSITSPIPRSDFLMRSSTFIALASAFASALNPLRPLAAVPAVAMSFFWAATAIFRASARSVAILAPSLPVRFSSAYTASSMAEALTRPPTFFVLDNSITWLR